MAEKKIQFAIEVFYCIFHFSYHALQLCDFCFGTLLKFLLCSCIDFLMLISIFMAIILKSLYSSVSLFSLTLCVGLCALDKAVTSSDLDRVVSCLSQRDESFQSPGPSSSLSLKPLVISVPSVSQLLREYQDLSASQGCIHQYP